jgi:zinc/manganese transport system permease protein
VNPHLTLNLVSDVRQLLAYRFMVNALQAASVVAVMAAVVGWFMVLRRETFAGHTLSVMSFPGAAAAALAGLPLAVGYFVFCIAGAGLIAAASGELDGAAARAPGRSLAHARPAARMRPLARARRLGRGGRAQQPAVIGTVQAGAFAVGFLLLSIYGGVLESLETLLFGSILGVTRAQVLTLAIVAAGTLAFLAIVGRPLFFASVDRSLARASRVPVSSLASAFLIVLALAVAATAQITGVLLVFALLVAPAAIARELTARIGLGLALSVALGLLIAWVGLGLSYFTNYSPGFFVTSIALVLFAGARAAHSARTVRARRARGGPGTLQGR